MTLSSASSIWNATKPSVFRSTARQVGSHRHCSDHTLSTNRSLRLGASLTWNATKPSVGRSTARQVGSLLQWFNNNLRHQRLVVAIKRVDNKILHFLGPTKSDSVKSRSLNHSWLIRPMTATVLSKNSKSKRSSKKCSSSTLHLFKTSTLIEKTKRWKLRISA